MAAAGVTRQASLHLDVGRLRQGIPLDESDGMLLRQVQFADGEVRYPRETSLADDLAALANGRGGELVLGVAEDTRDVLGIPLDRLDEVVRLVDRICWETVEPPLFASVEKMELPDVAGASHCVVRVSVERSLFVHRSPGGYVRRVGDSQGQPSPAALARLFQERSQSGGFSFDGSAVGGAVFDDLDAALVERFRDSRMADAREMLAERLGVARRSDDGRLRPTVAGLLIASERAGRWLPNAFIEAVAYRGEGDADSMTGGSGQIDVLDCHGPLHRQIADACRFVAKNQGAVGGRRFGRADQPLYDMTAIFEAVVNAVAHRDYSMYGPRICLRLFSDRLELCSPGVPPYGIALDALAYRQASRNNTVVGLLAKCPVPEGIPELRTSRATLMDRRGQGVGVILQRSEEHSGRLPVYEISDDSELRLTIFAAKPRKD